MHAYLDLLAISEIPGECLHASGPFMAACGGNTGNLLFRHALQGLVDLSAFEAMTYAELGRSLAEGKVYGSILISAANWIGASEQREGQCKTRADLILKAGLPVVVVGLGAQAPLQHGDLKLGPETLRFMAILSEHSKWISVRDEFTAKLFERNGFRNVIVTGCPSNFIRMGEPLEEVIGRRTHALGSLKPKAMSVAFSEISTGHPLSQKVLAKTLRDLSEVSDSQYVSQSSALIRFFFNEEESLPDVYLAAAAGAGMKREAAIELLRKKVRYFSSVPEWIGWLGRCHLVVGMRIHGAMAGIQAGIPSILIAHDSRTKGLGEVMGIPMITPEEYVSGRSGGLGRLAGLIQRDITGYSAKRNQLRQAMETVLFTGTGYKPAIGVATVAQEAKGCFPPP